MNRGAAMLLAAFAAGVTEGLDKLPPKSTEGETTNAKETEVKQKQEKTSKTPPEN